MGQVALAAFEQFRSEYNDWPSMAAGLVRMGDLATTGEVIVAEDEGKIVGGVAYIGSSNPKADYFEPSWPIIRMLIVHPNARGSRLGRRLTEACIERAIREARG